MIIGFYESSNFELHVMDLMEKLQDKIKTAEDLEQFSTELHESVETAIADMLEDNFNGIHPDDYNEPF